MGTTYLPGLTWRVVGRRLLRKPLATIFHLLDHVQATIGFDKEILPHIRRVRNVDINRWINIVSTEAPHTTLHYHNQYQIPTGSQWVPFVTCRDYYSTQYVRMNSVV